MTEPIFTDDRIERIREAADRAIPFLEASGYPLGVAWVRHRWRGGPVQDVLDALVQYQQPDGGFTGLEVDIKAPVSNAFAGRLAMQVMVSLREDADSGIAGPLGEWYARNQDEDGDWHFPPEVYEHALAPWFAAWEFPSLNPACSVAGLTGALGIDTAETQARVARLWEEKATFDQARSGDFYPMLPIVEYVAHIDVPDRETWLDALAEGVTRGIAANSFGDAGHALEHAVGGGPDLIVRLERDDLVKVIDSALADQSDDGGWPSPYDPAWRPWSTAGTLVLLSTLHDTVA
jgi:hypothetical protein